MFEEELYCKCACDEYVFLFLFPKQVKEERFHEHSLSWDTLQGFPKVELLGKVVLVRWNLSICQKGNVLDVELASDAIATISYLITSGARIVIASHWSLCQYPNGLMDCQMIAGVLISYFYDSMSIPFQICRHE